MFTRDISQRSQKMNTKGKVYTLAHQHACVYILGGHGQG